MKTQRILQNGYWICDIHNMYNDIISLHCAYCKYCKRPDVLNLLATQTIIQRRGLYHPDIIPSLDEILKGELMPSDDKELFIKLFAQEKTFVKDMNFASLRQRRDELRQIILEAKIRSAAVDDEERNLKSKMTAEQREWLVSNNKTDPSVSDAIEIVKERKKRISKSEKLAASLSELFGNDAAEDLVRNVQKKRLDDITVISVPKDKTVKSALCSADRHDECIGRFNDGVSRACECSCHHSRKSEVNPIKPLSINLDFLKK